MKSTESASGVDSPETARTDGGGTRPVRILIADDHPIFCAGVRALLEVESRFAVVGEGRNGREAVELTLSLEPDIALLDLSMPLMGGLDALAELRRRGALAHLVLLTAEIHRQQIVEALKLGARGVLLKDAAIELLHKCIHTVMAGQFWVGQEGVSDLVHYLCDPTSGPGGKSRYGLTPREREVVAAVADGLTNRDIAQQLSRSEDTIKHHLSNVFDKVGVSNRLELALFAIEHQLVDPRRAG